MKRSLLFALVAGLASPVAAQQAGAPMTPTPPALSLGAGLPAALGNPANSSGGVPLMGGGASAGDCLAWGATGIQDAGAPCVVAPIGGAKMSGTGASTATSLADRATDGGVTFNLKIDFGAKCDGATDDTAAIQAWLNKAAAGVRLEAPGGTCLFSSPLVAPTANNYAVAGAGVSATILRYTGASTSANLIALGSGNESGVAARDFSVSSVNPVTGAPLAINGAAFTPNDSASLFVVNVVDFGADPTGTNDSTAAFNAAFAGGSNFNTPADGYHPRPCVYVPAGNYLISDAVTLTPLNGCLFGDGRQLSVLNVYSTSFNLGAKGVLILPANNGSTASEVRDLGIAFWQPDTTSRSAVVAFPPGIYAQDASRPAIRRVRIGGGSSCIDARGNTGGAFYDDIECGALVTGMMLGSNADNAGALDGVHIRGWHFWDFGPLGAYPGLRAVWSDQTTVSMQIGRVDWLTVDDSQNYQGIVHYLAEASNSADPHQWTNVSMDSGQWLQEGGNVSISNLQGGYAPAVTLSGAGNPQLFVRNAILAAGQGPSGLINVSAGALEIDGGMLQCEVVANPCAVNNGGAMTIEHMQFVPSETGVWTAPYIKQISGPMRLEGNFFISNPFGGSAVGVSFTTDTAWNWFSPVSNQMNGWSWVQPTSGSSPDSYYGQGVVTMPVGPATFTATASDGVSGAGVTANAAGASWFAGVNGGGNFTINNANGASVAAWSDGHVSLGQNSAVTNESVGSLKVDQTLTVAGGALYVTAKTAAQITALACNSGDKGAIFEVTDLASAPTYYGAMGPGGGSYTSLVQCDGTTWRNH